MNDAIQLDRLSKRFKATEALKNVTLDVPEGSVFALLGENGAGKTTAIRIMLGLERPDSGHARVLGYDSASEDLDVRRRVGYVPETPDLYDWMTVEQIGWYAAGFYPPGYWDRFARMAGEFQLAPKTKIKNLSKGMRAKVSLSLALSHDPDLLILDEPTAGLDAMVRREFLESMVQRAADGRTVFLSSHQINEVERVAEYVALIRQGNLLLVERLDELKQRCRMISMTLAGEAIEPQLPEGRFIDCVQEGRRLRWLVADVPDARIGEIKSQDGVESVDVHRPDLEEIFVAHMQGSVERSESNDLASCHKADPSAGVEEVV
ncbi:ABC transporter ATP-binding protein [bacterium]|nr:ABC transporter ATP-binding protein [bacterium]